MQSRVLFLRSDKDPGKGAVIMLWILTGFTAMALGGYWFFALHPENLARFPSSANFYAVSYRFFAQTQVWLSGLTLAVFLLREVRLRWLVPFAAVYVLSLSSELAGTTTGFPFGDYAYTSLLGQKWFAHVPIVIPLSWFTMVLPSYVLTGRLVGWSIPAPVRWLLTGLLLTIWDLALDPAMSFLVPYWTWGIEGAYYGMPFVNLLGWLFTGTVLAAALDWTGVQAWQKDLDGRWLAWYYVVLFALPIGMLIAAGAWLAVVLSVVAFAGALEAYARFGRGEQSAGPSDAEGGAGFRAGSNPVSKDEAGEQALDNMVRIIAADAWTYFRQHSRSFSFASRLFNKKDQADVTRLYALCRTTDDLADRQDLGIEKRRQLLATWRRKVLESHGGIPSGVQWLDDLTARLRTANLPSRVIEDLFDGVESDLGPVRVQTMEELRLYSYRVASTVGVMMCYLFEETTPWKLARAASLGRGMQLTNIMRDVGEDLAIDRVYIPEELLSKHGLTESDLRDMKRTGVVLPNYAALMFEMECYAQSEYRKAWEAVPMLKPSFGRSVAVAWSVYGGIHRELRRVGYSNLTNRVYTSSVRKIFLAVSGVVRYEWQRLGGSPDDPHGAMVHAMSPVSESRV